MNLFVFPERGMCGMMDVNGNTVLEAKYEMLGLSCDGLIAFAKDRKWGVMDFKGNVVHDPEFSSIAELESGPIVVCKGILHGVLRRDGSYSCECKFTNLGRFVDGLAPARVDWDSKYGFVDSNGDFVIEPRFEAAECFSEGRAPVKAAAGRYGFIDLQGSMKVDCKYSLVGRFSEGLAAFSKVKAANKFGFLNPDGVEVLKPQWNGIELWFAGGLACVWKGEKYGYLNRSGEIAIPYSYDHAEPFHFGLAVCGVDSDEDSRYGFINATGDWVVEPRFVEANSFEGGLAFVATEDEEGFISVTGKWVKRWHRE